MNITITNTTIASSSDYDTRMIALVNLLNQTISQVALGLICIMGNIGSIFNCIVFSQPAFQKSPCAMYFIAASFSQLLTFDFALFTRMLHYGYNMKALNYELWYCKIRFYLFYIFVAVPRYNLIMATVDRFFASSRDALRRQWSSQKIAFRVIIANSILWCIIYIQVLVFYEINNSNCSYRGGSYGIFFSIYISIDSGVLPISLMLIFGLLTVKHVHQSKQRIVPAPGNNDAQANQTGRMSKKDAQLHKMLANQILLFLILNIPNPCYLVYQSFIVNSELSPLRRASESFASNMTYVLVYLGFSLTFANFFISSEIFRREFIQLIRTKVLRQNPRRTTSTGGATTVKVLRPTDGEE
ncbi:unnamed protein product [Adineta steineri]|uniref:G-protein coupled receptors family 1 profile domain-containing protein n=1 Tax=Adineta steineri TaxID=433720 RepID=A0A814CQU3_9BILA|nr:unnamed protein product [Adineta steineri]CAF3916684.1 unnamed protein product [Adineta steineri]